jgi:hypothetical protein
MASAIVGPMEDSITKRPDFSCLKGGKKVIAVPVPCVACPGPCLFFALGLIPASTSKFCNRQISGVDALVAELMIEYECKQVICVSWLWSCLCLNSLSLRPGCTIY